MIIYGMKGTDNMKCPFCGYDNSKVIDSRPAEENITIRRRRQCESCNQRFTTYEKIETIPLMVIKKDKTREPYKREKLVRGIVSSCNKRPVSVSDIEQLVDEIESSMFNALKKEIESKKIGEMVLEKLKEIDEVAYIRFASVYREFNDTESFFHELQQLKKEK